MKPVVFVLSTGRTGTSYVADVLRRACNGQVEAHHERLTSQACARRFFRRYDLLEECRRVPGIKNMLESIHETTTRVPYIDTGWTLHSLLPLFLQEFPDQV